MKRIGNSQIRAKNVQDEEFESTIQKIKQRNKAHIKSGESEAMG